MKELVEESLKSLLLQKFKLQVEMRQLQRKINCIQCHIDKLMIEEPYFQKRKRNRKSH